MVVKVQTPTDSKFAILKIETKSYGTVYTTADRYLRAKLMQKWNFQVKELPGKRVKIEYDRMSGPPRVQEHKMHIIDTTNLTCDCEDWVFRWEKVRNLRFKCQHVIAYLIYKGEVKRVSAVGKGQMLLFPHEEVSMEKIVWRQAPDEMVVNLGKLDIEGEFTLLEYPDGSFRLVLLTGKERYLILHLKDRGFFEGRPTRVLSYGLFSQNVPHFWKLKELEERGKCKIVARGRYQLREGRLTLRIEERFVERELPSILEFDLTFKGYRRYISKVYGPSIRPVYVLIPLACN